MYSTINYHVITLVYMALCTVIDVPHNCEHFDLILLSLSTSSKPSQNRFEDVLSECLTCSADR